MAEYIFVHVGQAGIQIGQSLWEQFYLEHSNQDGAIGDISTEIGNPHSLFYEEKENSFVPRAIFADLEPDVMDTIFHTDIGKFFDNKSFIYGKDGGSNNYNQARYISGREIGEHIENWIYSMLEMWDNFKGVIMTNSIGGSCGSAVGDIISQFTNNSKIKTYRFCVTSSPKFSSIIVEPYNEVLCFHELISNQYPNVLFDNESWYRILSGLGFENPSLNEINQLISLQIWNLIAPTQYNSENNVSLDWMFNSLTPFKNLNFVISSYSPFISEEDKFEALTVDEITSQVFKNDNTMISCKREQSKNLSSYLNYFGDCSSIDVKNGIQSLIDNKIAKFPDWTNWLKTNITNRIKIKESENRWLSYLYNNLRSWSMLSNSTSIVDPLNSICRKFDLMYAKRVFVHWYSGIGLSEGYFMEAREDIKGMLIKQ